MTVRIETTAGNHILDVLRQAVAESQRTQDDVVFDFNGVEHEVLRGQGFEAAKARAEQRAGHPTLTREQTASKIEKERLEREAEYERKRKAGGHPSEAELRGSDVPWPESEEELVEYIAALVDRPHDYGTCVYAMSMAAVAAFRYVGSRLGVTGFQSSCADMDILRRTRGLEHGFRLVDYAGALYPQYWDEERAPIFRKVLEEDGDRIREQARENLEASPHAAPEVVAHWRILASGGTPC